MITICHRGNQFGPNLEKENQPIYINEALNAGYHVEIDAWLCGGIYYLGHDKPTYIVDINFFKNPKIWVHCKNIQALDDLLLDPDINCFSHDKDDYVLTSHRYIWVYPNANIKLTENSIAVLPEKVKHWDLGKCYGICTDYVNFNKV